MEGMRELIPDNSIDLTVTSPPYDNIRDYNGYSFDWKATISELYRVTKQGGIVVWIVSDQTVDGSESGTSFKQALWAKECGFNLHDTMIWNKRQCVFPDANRYLPSFEYMFVFSKGTPSTTNLIADRLNIEAGRLVRGTDRQKDGTLKPRTGNKLIPEYGYRFNVWDLPPEKQNRTGHPAVFPIKIAQDHIKSWSNEGDTVLDPFLGSGTTRLAAYELKRQFIGFEISEEYFDKQEERFARHTAQMSLFVEGGAG
jgi:site-specific DNA-methyltransferase (adenine-specific)